MSNYKLPHTAAKIEKFLNWISEILTDDGVSITNIVTPTAIGHAANKGYVDSVAETYAEDTLKASKEYADKVGSETASVAETIAYVVEGKRT